MTRPPGGGVVSWTRGREIVAHPLDYAFVTALLLALVQMFGPQLRSMLGAHGRQVQSFGGGVGLAYVFLQLFPEIDEIPHWLGDHVHIVTLTSFLLFFALEAWLILRYRHRRVPAGEEHASVPSAVFWLHIGVLFFYTSIVMFTLPKDVSEDFLFAAASGLALGMHCVYKDYVLRSHAGSQFQTTGRVLLTVAPLLGWLAHRLYHPPEMVLDLFIAVLAGILMQSVFRDEIPNPDAASVRWIVAGVAAFGVLAVIY